MVAANNVEDEASVRGLEVLSTLHVNRDEATASAFHAWNSRPPLHRYLTGVATTRSLSIPTQSPRHPQKCEMCQRAALKPSHFRVLLARADDVFNTAMCLAIMKIASRSVLHCVEKATKFGAARFLPRKLMNDEWTAFNTKQIYTYVGAPDRIATNSGPVDKTSCQGGLPHNHEP